MSPPDLRLPDSQAAMIAVIGVVLAIGGGLLMWAIIGLAVGVYDRLVR